LSQSEGLFELAPWQAGRIRNGREGLITKNLVGDIGEES